MERLVSVMSMMCVGFVLYCVRLQRIALLSASRSAKKVISCTLCNILGKAPFTFENRRQDVNISIDLRARRFRRRSSVRRVLVRRNDEGLTRIAREESSKALQPHLVQQLLVAYFGPSVARPILLVSTFVCTNE